MTLSPADGRRSMSMRQTTKAEFSMHCITRSHLRRLSCGDSVITVSDNLPVNRMPLADARTRTSLEAYSNHSRPCEILSPPQFKTNQSHFVTRHPKCVLLKSNFCIWDIAPLSEGLSFPTGHVGDVLILRVLFNIIRGGLLPDTPHLHLASQGNRKISAFLCTILALSIQLDTVHYKTTPSSSCNGVSFGSHRRTWKTFVIN